MKRKAGPPTVNQRLLQLRRGRVRELAGVAEWIVTLNGMHLRSPEDQWVIGMLRHYTSRKKQLEATLAALDKDLQGT